MKYQPIVLKRDQYFKSINYDEKYSRAMDDLSQDKNDNQNVSPKQIAYKIADYEYQADKEKQKNDIEIGGSL